MNTLITYDFLLHVSTLIRHLQGALCAWLKLHILLILIKCNMHGTGVKIPVVRFFVFLIIVYFIKIKKYSLWLLNVVWCR